MIIQTAGAGLTAPDLSSRAQSPSPAAQSAGRREPGRRHAAIAALNALCWLLAGAVLAWRCSTAVRGSMLDLQVYAGGGNAIRHGLDLYAFRSPDGLAFTYPPAAAVLAVALTVLPFTAAKAAWAAGMVCMPLAVVVRVAFRPLAARAGRLGPAALAVMLAGAALTYPLAREFAYGQVDIFLVALCLADLTPGRTRWPRGVLIGLAAAIKLEPAVFIVYLLITRRRRDAAVAMASFAACTAAAWLVSPRDSARYWTGALLDTGRIGGNAAAQNQSLRGIILRAFEPHPGLVAPAAVWAAVALAVAALGFAAARACWHRGDDLAGIAITGLLAALLSPVAWIHHYCWIVVVLGVLIADGRSPRRLAAAAAAAALFTTTSLPAWAQGWLTRGFPVLPGRLLEDSLGLTALGLLLIIYRAGPSLGDTAPASSRQPAEAPGPRLPAGTAEPRIQVTSSSRKGTAPSLPRAPEGLQLSPSPLPGKLGKLRGQAG